MSLSSLQLDAFQAVIAERNFSKAAKQLKITQGALSQRIQKLEKELETTLLRRSASGVEPTDAGWKLAQYCQAKGRVEDEVIEELSGKRESQSLSGFLRIAGYSSVTRSVLQPSLAPLLREHPNLQIEFRTEPIEKLPQLLLQGEVDFLVLDHVLTSQA